MVYLYVLKLEHDKYYVGITSRVSERLTQHMQGEGAKWTKLHPPREIVHLAPFATRNLALVAEEKATLVCAAHGKDVRGGSLDSTIGAGTRESTVRGTPHVIQGDAFARNHADIKPFLRAFYRQHKALPTTPETLDWIKANGRYSGDWEDRESKRAKRVEQILRFTEQTFDPSKLSTGQGAVHLAVGRYSWWVRQHFGSVMTAQITNLHRFTPETMTAPMGVVHVPANFIETFLAVVQFCVKQDPLDNKAVPTNRIKKIWEMVEGGASWNQHYYQIVRDRLQRMGVIRIVDREHAPGKAWRWEAGEAFPKDTWKEEQRRCKVKHAPASADGENRDIYNREEKVHNTLYQDAQQITSSCCAFPLVRPPP